MFPKVTFDLTCDPPAEIIDLTDRFPSVEEDVTVIPAPPVEEDVIPAPPVPPEPVCAICLETVSFPYGLPCKHVFCEPCILKWMCRGHIHFNFCPLCHEPIVNTGDHEWATSESHTRVMGLALNIAHLAPCLSIFGLADATSALAEFIYQETAHYI